MNCYIMRYSWLHAYKCFGNYLLLSNNELTFCVLDPVAYIRIGLDPVACVDYLQLMGCFFP